MTKRHLLACWTAIVLLLWLSSPAIANWLPESRITTSSVVSYLSQNNARSLVTDQSGVVHLVWYDLRDGDSEIYHKSFNGVVWGPETALTQNTSVSENPAAAVDSNGILHVVWADMLSGNSEIYHKAFDGMGWTPAAAATESSAVSQNPSLAADGLGRLHLVWRDYRDGGWGIFYAMFDDLTWSEDLRISDPVGYPLQASIACDDSQHVHVVWDDYRHTNWEIYYRRFDGLTWAPEVRLTNDTDISENPAVIADTYGAIHVFWDDNRAGINSFNIYQKTFDGVAWSADTKIVDAVAGALAPSVTAGPDGALHLVWYDSPGDYHEVYYTGFDGISWGPVDRLSQASANSENPMIAVDSSGLPHVIWHDDRNDNFAIYWRTWGILPKPEITSIEPDSGLAYTFDDGIDLAGANFFAEVEVWLQKDGEVDFPTSNEVIVSATRIICDLDLWDAPAGEWDVVVENLDLQRDTLFTGFRVIPLPPIEISSIDPDMAVAYEDVRVAEISGQGFFPAATVRLEKAGEDDIPATNVTFESPTRITCDFNLTEAHPEDWDLVIENPDEETGILPGGFTILPSRWGDDLRLTYDDADSDLSKPNARTVAVDSQGHLHIVWSDVRDGPRQIYYKSFDGMSWSADLRLTVSDYGPADPAITVDGNDNLHVVWNDHPDGGPGGDYMIYHKSYNGTTWSPDTRLTYAPGNSRYPSIAVDGDNKIYVVWQENHGGEEGQYIHFRMYDGDSWLGEEIVANDVEASGTPAIAADGNNHVHVVWYQDLGLQGRLYHRKFDGLSWGDTCIVTDSRSVYGPTIATDSLNQVHVAWHARRDGNYEIFYKRFNGLTWDTENRVTSMGGTSANASVVVDDSGYVHLVWMDERDGNYEIYYARKEESSWIAQARLTKDPAESRHPSLALAPDGSLHMVWRDLRDGNREIYYKTRASDELAAIDDRVSDLGPVKNLRVSPNPVRGSARIQFSLALRAEPGLSVYDVSGRLVMRIEAGLMGPGPQSIAWNGKGATGKPVAQGIYFVEVSARGHAASTKIIVLRSACPGRE